MADHPILYQPGAMLHEAIVGSFRARGASFEVWIAEQGITPAAARAATFGQSRGPQGRALLDRLIEAAGRDVVRTAYVARLRDHVESFTETEGAQG